MNMLTRAAILSGAVIVAHLIAVPALAQTSTAKTKVDIEADQMELFEARNEAVFRGNVRASRADMKLWSNTLLVKFSRDNAGKTEVTSLETSGGGVKIVTRTQTINGDWMKMNVKSNTAVVGGGVTVQQGSSVVRGDKLDVNLTTNESKFSGGRVKGSFLPE